MAIKFVVQVGDEVLRTVCEPVKNFGGELSALLDDMR